MQEVAPYKPQNKVRIVTAASLFDGHDAAINIMRRIIQATGCEVIHLGHDRSVDEVVNTAIQEDAQAVTHVDFSVSNFIDRIFEDVEEMFMPGEGSKILNYHNLKRIEGNE